MKFDEKKQKSVKMRPLSDNFLDIKCNNDETPKCTTRVYLIGQRANKSKEAEEVTHKDPDFQPTTLS